MNKILTFATFVFFAIQSSTFPQVPEWAKGIVWYQIFPERFANGDPTNDPDPEKTFIRVDSIPGGWEIKEWTSNWFEQDEWEKKMGGHFNNHIYERRYGGDIQGIIDRLDYLKELGIGAIYLNPIFEAASLHKYDGSTFHHIDVNFGPDPEGDRKLIASETPDDPATWKWIEADKLFLELVEEVHSRDMKIIIDGVFNHTGVQFWAFQDIVENGQDSKYKDWFRIISFDDPETPENEFDYHGWWGVKSLPEFNKDSQDLHRLPKQYIFHSTKRWMDPNNDGDPSDGINGWRLDVAREVPLGFWKSWARMVKAVNKDAIIVGELWELSPDFVSAEGPFDALMNYNFAFAVNNFMIADKSAISTEEFVEVLEEVNSTYPKANLLALQNLMSSHDTDRLSSMIKNPDRKFDHDAKEHNPSYNPGKPTKEEYEKQKLIAAFQMTYLGAPMIYYGDEVGMWGADDPHDRKPMVWDELSYDDELIDESSGFGTGYDSYEVSQNEDLLYWYKKVTSIRNQNKSLRLGKQRFLYVSDGTKTFAFERTYENERMICAFNLEDEEQMFTIPMEERKIFFTELICNEDGSVAATGTGVDFPINLPGNSVRIYKIKTISRSGE
ncbi:MAG: alpha-glucosidase C-terminal domain-containing protein [Ignavibacterium sp.]|nr:MAG: alpha-glucosidase C-terminal domain-containing protein [Ignavibacterium sp.]